MDAGTGFTTQVYELSPLFLHKVSFLTHYAILFYLLLYTDIQVPFFVFSVGDNFELQLANTCIKFLTNNFISPGRSGLWSSGKKTTISPH